MRAAALVRLIAAAVAASGGCGAPAAAQQALSVKLQHVVIVVQENRSFDNLFQGYPGADTVASGKDSHGDTIPLRAIPLEAPYGIRHDSADFFAACNGTGSIPGTNCAMDGFDLESYAREAHTPKFLPYAYVPHRETKLYFQMAHRYVVADRMFTSNIDASFTSHQYIIAAQAHSAVDLPGLPWGCPAGPYDLVTTLLQNRTYGPAERPCFNYRTIGDELDARGLPWRFYADSGPGYLWLAYQAVRHIRNSPDWPRHAKTPAQRFLRDVARGELDAVTWVTPTCPNSDHAGCGGNTGPAWVASVVNAVGESKFWPTTAIFVMWDEWGGWYDHVPPPYEDYDGLGIRVPLLVISPYAKRDYVSHVQYEHGSILRFVEDLFGLHRLAASDARANSPAADCFDFAGPPRPFVPFAIHLGDWRNVRPPAPLSATDLD